MPSRSCTFHYTGVLTFPLVLVLLFIMTAAIHASDDGVSRTYISASPDLLSAYAIAWDAHKNWSKNRGKPIDEKNLSEFSWSVYIVREESGTILVSFSPPKPEILGGSVEYRVDGKTFRVIEQRFAR